MLLARFYVFVRQGSCEDDLILIRNKTSAESTLKSVRTNKRTAFRCTFCAETKRSRKCLAIRFTAEKQARVARRVNSKKEHSVAHQNAAQERPHDAGEDVRVFSRQTLQHSTNPGAKSSGRALIQPSMIVGGKNLPVSISLRFNRSSPP